jgi:hypothetical protein
LVTNFVRMSFGNRFRSKNLHLIIIIFHIFDFPPLPRLRRIIAQLKLKVQ